MTSESKGAVLAEAGHSVADTVNQVFLLVGIDPSDTHRCHARSGDPRRQHHLFGSCAATRTGRRTGDSGQFEPGIAADGSRAAGGRAQP